MNEFRAAFNADNFVQHGRKKQMFFWKKLRLENPVMAKLIWRRYRKARTELTNKLRQGLFA